MTTPDPGAPQPRDIALEMATPEQAADLDAQSDADRRTDGGDLPEEPAAGR